MKDGGYDIILKKKRWVGKTLHVKYPKATKTKTPSTELEAQ